MKEISKKLLKHPLDSIINTKRVITANLINKKIRRYKIRIKYKRIIFKLNIKHLRIFKIISKDLIKSISKFKTIRKQ